MKFEYFICGLFILINVLSIVSAGDYILNAAKHVPRIGRASNKNTNIDEMGKFFMKASKSVPRIGRRNNKALTGADFDYERNPEYSSGHIQNRAQNSLWNDIAYKFEYEPELFVDDEFLKKLEENMGDSEIPDMKK